LNDQELSEEDKSQVFQLLVSNTENSANSAVQLNPKNSQNWLQKASVYENFMSLGIEGTGELAVSSYQKAEQLSPQNPEIPFILGRVYKSQAERIQVQIALLEQAEEKDEEAIKKLEENREKIFDMAIEKLKKSAQLKIDFSPAYYLMAQVYELKGEKELALENYKIVLLLEPGNEEVKDKVEQLQE